MVFGRRIAVTFEDTQSMANTSSAKKAVRQIARRTSVNR
ncbi:MAG: 30S ribosomal protein S20, partial [Methylocystis sp.]